jgi:D-glycero-D-manno-heptose 1,7-bisphosphate phosphatase
MRRAVFWDRDGTLIEEVGYCGDPAQVRVFPGVREALRKLTEAGFLNIIVSNQSGIARGYFTEEQYRAVQREVLRQIDDDNNCGSGGSLIVASYFCADAPDTPSLYRKPAPGMLLKASAEFGIDLSHSVMVGDKATDIECARRAGTRSVLVATGYGSSQNCQPDIRVADAPAAAEWVLRHLADPN